jgi:1,4-alpha-glucan branching enzyme
MRLMVHIELDGRLILSVDLPGASQVEVVGNFTGWHEQRMPMTADAHGRWTLELSPSPGEVLFRYLVDGAFWVLDGTSHGTRTTACGQEMSRVWMPPLTIEPDSIAA